MVGRSAVVSLVGGFGVLVLSSALSGAAPSGPPVRIGSTLALTGPLASQAIIHKIVADIYVDRLNRKNGLLGRPVDYVLLDDQSKPEVTRVLYERLITSDKVDLVLGAFGTGLNMAAMPVAQRYQKILITATMGIPKLSTYDMHFSTQGIGAEPEKAFPNSVFDALASTGKPPRTVAIVTSKFPSLHFISVGAREVATKRGMSVSLYLEYEFGTRDFGPIAARIKEANADFLWAGALGMEGNMLLEALAKIGHAPRGHLYIFPASGPLAQLPEATRQAHGLAAEQAGDDLEVLGEPADPRLERQPEGPVLGLVPARPDTEDEPSTGQVVEGCGHLGHDSGGPEGGAQHERAELHPGHHWSDGRQRRPGLVRALVRLTLEAPDQVVEDPD